MVLVNKITEILYFFYPSKIWSFYLEPPNEYYSKSGNVVDTNVEPVEPCVHVLYTLK